MRIDLDDRFSIDGDGNSCFTLIEKSVISGEYSGRGKRPNPENIGQIRESAVGYFGSLSHALSGYSRYCVAMSHGTVDISGIIQKLSDIEKTISKVVK